MSETVEDLTIHYEEEGVVKVKELNKEVLSKGAWATIIYLYQEWSAKNEDYGPLKATIRRYRKMSGTYRQQSKFNISSAKQAKQLVEVLNQWFEDEE